MSFITNKSLSAEQVEAIERVHEELVNNLGWDTHKFEVRPADPESSEDILIHHLE